MQNLRKTLLNHCLVCVSTSVLKCTSAAVEESSGGFLCCRAADRAYCADSRTHPDNAFLRAPTTHISDESLVPRISTSVHPPNFCHSDGRGGRCIDLRRAPQAE